MPIGSARLGFFYKKTRYINSLLLQLAQAAQAVHRTETWNDQYLGQDVGG